MSIRRYNTRIVSRKPRGLGNLSVIGDEATSSTPIVFLYHRYVGLNPQFAAETEAIKKGIIPIISISNSTYSWGSNYETAALAFQAAKGCTIALVQSFWAQTATVAVAWDTAEYAKYYAKRQAESRSLIMMMDVEPPDVSPTENSIPDQLLNTKTGDTYGVAGTAEQVAAARAWVAAQERYSYCLPDLRYSTSLVKTTDGSLYNILPALGIAQINEATYTYAPSTDYSAVLLSDVIGIRVSLDGTNSSYTPAQAKAAWPGRSKMYFPTPSDTTEAAYNAQNWSPYLAELLQIVDGL